MSMISFGEYSETYGYNILDERVMRGSAGLMLLFGSIASINGFILKNYIVIPYFAGFLVLNFLIGIFINPKFSPTVVISSLLVRKQAPLAIGAIQKKFAWTLGLGLSTAILAMSIPLLNDPTWFDPVCLLCLVCLFLLYLETAFGICVGCQLYFLGIRFKLIKTPDVMPNCTGASCETD